MENREIMLIGLDIVEYVRDLCNKLTEDAENKDSSEFIAYKRGMDHTLEVLKKTLEEIVPAGEGDHKNVALHVPGLTVGEEFATVEEAFGRNTAYFRSGDIEAAVVGNKVRWEIPIDNLLCAFENSPSNPSDDGINFASIKDGREFDFAKFIADMMIKDFEADAEAGESYISHAIEEIFLYQIFEHYRDFVQYPDDK